MKNQSINQSINQSLKIVLSLTLLIFLCNNETFAQIKVDANGRVGINNSSPTKQLDVKGDIKTSGDIEMLGDYADFNFDMSYGDPKLLPTSNNYGDLGSYNYQLHAVWSTSIYGNRVLLTSDERKKENIKPLKDVLSKITKIEGKKYDFKVDNINSIKDEARREKFIKESKNHVGFIAQELENIIPEAVSYDEENDGYFVDYIALVPYLVESIKEQQIQIEELKTIIKNNKTKSVSTQSAPTTNNDDDEQITDVAAALNQNIPNPFNKSTKIAMYIPSTVTKAVLYIYNMQGNQIASHSITERQNASITIEGNELDAGMYLYTLITDGKEVDTKRMILTK